MLSVLIPVYNEEATLRVAVQRVLDLGLPVEIIIVDDASSDGTPAVISSLQMQYPHVKTCRHAENRGKGCAIKTGLELVTGDTLVIQDADLEYHPADYPAALRLIQQDGADAVYGSRFLGPHRVFLLWHLIANKFLTTLVNIICDSTLSDMETGFKVFRTEVFRSLQLESDKFDFEVEVTVKLFRRKARVYEIPITYTGRTYSEGKKITWLDGLHALWAIAYWGLVA